MTPVTLETIMVCMQQMSEAYVALADTVSSVSARIDVAVKTINSRIDESEASRNVAFSQLRNTVEARLEEMRSGLHAANEESSAAVGVSIGAMRTSMVEVSRDVEGLRASLMAESRATLERFSAIEKTTEDFHDDLNAKLDAVAAIGSKHAEHVDLLSEQLSRVRELCDGVRADHAATFKGVCDGLDEVREKIAGASTQVSAVTDTVKEAYSRIDSLEKSVAENSIAVESVAASTTGLSITADNLRTELDRYINSADEKAVEFSTRVESVVNDLSGEARLALSVAGKAVETASGAVEKSSLVSEQLLAVSNEVAALGELTKTVSETLAVGSEDYSAKLDSTLAAVRSATAEDLATVDARIEKLVAELTGSVSAGLDKLEKRLDELPEPAPPVVTVTTPRLDVRATDSGLEVCLLADDGSVAKAVAVPVSVGLRYTGTYDQNKAHRAGDVVTHNGSMWLCNGGNTDAPGKDFTGWRLVVKRGSDGRSIRSYGRHEHGALYYPGDLLKAHGRLWQAEAKTAEPPEGAQVSSSEVWSLISGVL